MNDPDDALRNACFTELRRLTKLHTHDIPYRGVLERGFSHDGALIAKLERSRQ